MRWEDENEDDTETLREGVYVLHYNTTRIILLFKEYLIPDEKRKNNIFSYWLDRD